MEQIGSVVYINDKRIYDTYYSDKSKWPNKGFTYVYGSPPVVKAKKPTVKPQGSYHDGVTGGQGSVFIVKPGQKLTNLNPQDIVVIDKRTDSNPNMKVVNSQKIIFDSAQKEIIDILLEYNKNNPVDPPWNRTAITMSREWKAHNVLYMFNVQRSRTVSVDFDNEDEYNLIYGRSLWD